MDERRLVVSNIFDVGIGTNIVTTSDKLSALAVRFPAAFMPNIAGRRHVYPELRGEERVT